MCDRYTLTIDESTIELIRPRLRARARYVQWCEAKHLRRLEVDRELETRGLFTGRSAALAPSNNLRVTAAA
jgi:hypothetical protein